MDQHLFAVYVGGHVPGGNIEVHDMRFVVGEDVTACYDDLRAQWWGAPKTLHLDGWIALDSLDGYRVALGPEAPKGPERLFFVNLGGYCADRFEEDHENLFIVAESQKDAVAKAKASSTRFGHLHKGTQLHKDTVFDVDSVMDLSAVGRGRGLHIHLRADPAARPGPYTASYVPISIRSEGGSP